MALLSVNLDAIGTLRESGRTKEPDPSQAAVLVEFAGADGISVRFFPNRRAIRERDLYLLREIVRTRLTIEIPATEETVSKILEIKPWMAVLSSPMAGTESRERTLEPNDSSDVKSFVSRLRGAGILVGVLLPAIPDAAKFAQKNGVDAVVIDCETYGEARIIDDAQRQLDLIDKTAEQIAKARLFCKAAHGISYKSVAPLVELGFFDEFFIGHSIASRAIGIGLPDAVREMLELVRAPVMKRS